MTFECRYECIQCVEADGKDQVLWEFLLAQRGYVIQ